MPISITKETNRYKSLPRLLQHRPGSRQAGSSCQVRGSPLWTCCRAQGRREELPPQPGAPLTPTQRSVLTMSPRTMAKKWQVCGPDHKLNKDCKGWKAPSQASGEPTSNRRGPLAHAQDSPICTSCMALLSFSIPASQCTEEKREQLSSQCTV